MLAHELMHVRNRDILIATMAAAVAGLHLKHAVITSVTRDDLPDGGSGAFAVISPSRVSARPSWRMVRYEISWIAPRACGLAFDCANTFASACGRAVPVRTCATALAAPSRQKASESARRSGWKPGCSTGLTS